MRIHLVLIRVPARQLLLAGQGPRDAAVVVIRISAAKGLTRSIVLTAHGADVDGEEAAGEVELVREVPGCREEPQSIALDGPSDGDVQVVQRFQRCRSAAEPACLQPVRYVVALKTRCGTVGERAAAECVAAGL